MKLYVIMKEYNQYPTIEKIYQNKSEAIKWIQDNWDKMQKGFQLYISKRDGKTDKFYNKVSEEECYITTLYYDDDDKLRLYIEEYETGDNNDR